MPLQLPLAGRGIVAGSPVATSELKLAVYGLLACALEKAGQVVAGATHTSIHLAVQVDDIILAVISDSPRLAVVATRVLWEAAWACFGRAPPCPQHLARLPFLPAALASSPKLGECSLGQLGSTVGRSSG